jgi:hypothetical protein
MLVYRRRSFYDIEETDSTMPPTFVLFFVCFFFFFNIVLKVKIYNLDKGTSRQHFFAGHVN